MNARGIFTFLKNWHCKSKFNTVIYLPMENWSLLNLISLLDYEIFTIPWSTRKAFLLSLNKVFCEPNKNKLPGIKIYNMQWKNLRYFYFIARNRFRDWKDRSPDLRVTYQRGTMLRNWACSFLLLFMQISKTLPRSWPSL